MVITEILRRIWLFSANKIKSSEYLSKQPTQLIIAAHNSHNCLSLTQESGFKSKSGSSQNRRKIWPRFDVFIIIRAAGTGVIFDNSSWFGLYWGIFLNWIWRYFAWHFWFSGCWGRGLFWFRIRIGNGSCRGCWGCWGFANLSNDLGFLGLIKMNSFTFWIDNFFFC
jgi:hypothetical protein